MNIFEIAHRDFQPDDLSKEGFEVMGAAEKK